MGLARKYELRNLRFVTLGGSLVLVLWCAGGCMTKSQAHAQAQAAFLAGQQQGMAQAQQASHPTVTFVGPVQNQQVPWTPDLTLSKAVVAAGYQGTADPSVIFIVRRGVARSYDPKQLLSGQDVFLEAGDVVELRP
jgi:hypothetical protein